MKLYSKTIQRIVLASIGMLIACFAVLTNTLDTRAEISRMINFAGKVTNTNGTEVTDGNYDFTFSLYDSPSGGTQVWTETLNTSNVFSATIQSYNSGTYTYTYTGATATSTLRIGQHLTNSSTGEAVLITAYDTSANTITVVDGSPTWSNGQGINTRPYVEGGVIDVNMGSVGDLSTVNFDQPLYLEITFNGETMQPRKIIAAAAQAFNADMLDGFHATDFATISGTVEVTGDWTFDNSVAIVASTTIPALSVTQHGTGEIMNFYDNDDNLVFTVLNDGRVGIGTSTPENLLDVNGDIGIRDQNELRLYELALNGNQYAGFRASSTLTSDLMWTLPTTQGGDGDSLMINSNGDLEWQVAAIGTVNSGTTGQFPYYASDGDALTATSSLFLSESGNIGIGTTTPSEELAVAVDQNGSTRIELSNFNSGVSANSVLELMTDGGSGFLYRTSNVYTGWASAIQDDLVLQESGGGDLVFQTSVEAMRILNDGTIDMKNHLVDNVANLDIQALAGAGIRFWGSDLYAINMGDAAEYQYGPVTDFSIKNNMSNTAGRGWTWGIDGVAPVAAIGVNGNMQIAGTFAAMTNLGVGINSPEARLHVQRGAASATRPTWTTSDVAIIENSATEHTVLQVFSDFSTSANIAFSNENARAAGSISYIHSLYEMQFSASGTTPLVVSGSGNVGIGTSTTPEATLHVKKGSIGATSPTWSSSDVAIFENNYADSTGVQILSANDKWAYIGFSDSAARNSGLVAYNHADDSLNFRTASNPYSMTMAANGYVGIGTTNALVPLSVQGTAGAAIFNIASSTGDSLFYVDAQGEIGIGTTDPDSALEISSDSGAQLKLGYTGSAHEATFTVDTDGLFTIESNEPGDVYIDPTSKFGVGTSSPLANLTVYGDVLIEGSSRYVNFGTVIGTAGYGIYDNSGTLQIKNQGSDWTNVSLIGDGQTGWVPRYYGNHNNLQATSSIFITNAGNVGIGTSTATSKLSMGGDIDMNSKNITEGGLINFADTYGYGVRWNATGSASVTWGNDPTYHFGAVDVSSVKINTGALGSGTGVSFGPYGETPTTTFNADGTMTLNGFAYVGGGRLVVSETATSAPASIYVETSQGIPFMQFATSTGDIYLAVTKEGYLGLNNENPSVFLHVGSANPNRLSGVENAYIEGSVEMDGQLYVDGVSTSTLLGSIDLNGALSVGADNFFVNNTGVVTSGTWQGTAVNVDYGGTGLTSVNDGYFLIGTGGSSLEATSTIFMADNGYVGIGSTTPGFNLAVTGTLYADDIYTSTSTFYMGGVPILTFVGNQNIMTLYEDSVNGSNTLSLIATSSLATDVTYSLPAPGTTGQALLLGADNNLYWGDAGSGSGSGDVGTGTTGQVPYYSADGTAVSATSSLFIADTGNVGVGTTTGISTELYVDGDVMVTGNVLSYASSTIGSASTRFKIGYFDDIDVLNGVSAPASANGTDSSSFTINTDNVTADTEDSSLAFERGSVTPNASITWNSTDDRFDINQPIHLDTNNLITLGSAGFGVASPQATVSIQGTGGTDIFNIASSTGDSLFHVDSLGNIGLGTTTPDNALDLVGDFGIKNQNSIKLYELATNGVESISLRATSSLAADTTYTLPGAGTVGQVLVLGNDNNLYWDNAGAGSGTVGSGSTGQVPYYAAGGTTLTATSSLAIATSGYVGVGTSSPAYQLDVYGNARIDGNITADNLNVTNWDTAYGWGDHSIAGYNTQAFASSTYLTKTAYFASTTPAHITGLANLNTVGTISTGSWQADVLGVGYGGTGTTTAPSYGQILVGDGTDYELMSTSSLNIAITDTTGILTTAQGGIGLDSSSWSGMVSVSAGTWSTVTGTANNFAYWSDANTVAATSTMYLADSTYIGIGTTTPQDKLEIVGNLGIANQNSLKLYELGTNGMNYIGFRATSSVATDTTYTWPGAGTSGQVLALGADNNLYWTDSGGGGGSGTVNSGTTGQFPYYAADGTTLTGTSSIVIDTAGRIGVGTTTPAYGFDVYGDTANYVARIHNDNTTVSSGGLFVQADGSGNILNLNSNGSDIVTITAAQTVFNNPVSFGSAGDVSIAYDLYFTNDTAAYINFNGPGYIRTDSAWQNLDLTLSAANSGQVIIDDELVITGGATSSLPLLIDSETTSTSTPSDGLFRIVSDVNTNENVVFKVDAGGNVTRDGSDSTPAADYAEYYFTHDSDLQSGEAVCVDVTENNAVKRCERASDGNVMGIVSTQPAIIGNAKEGYANNDDYVIIGMLGQVPAKVSTENGVIRPGDSLTSASLAGYVMKAGPGDPTVGVALEAFGEEPVTIEPVIEEIKEEVATSTIDTASSTIDIASSSDEVIDTASSTEEIPEVVEEEPVVIATGEINVLISRRNKSLTVEMVESRITDHIAEMEIEDEVQILIANAVDTLDLDNEIQPIVDEQIALFDERLTVEFDTFNDELTIIAGSVDGLIDRMNIVENGIISLGQEQVRVNNEISEINEQLIMLGANSVSTLQTISVDTDSGLVITNDNYRDKSEPAVSIVEITTASTTNKTAFVVNQLGDGDVVDFQADGVSIVNIADDGKVSVVGEISIDGRMMVCSGAGCGSALDEAVDETMGDMGVEGKVVAGAFESVCEEGFVWVPGSSKYGTMPGFCVMSTEARIGGGNIPTTKLEIEGHESTIWTNVSQGEAQLACQAMGDNYHLISENEWLTIAENIIRVSENDIEPDQTGLQLATFVASTSESIAFTLSNGNMIYDLVGQNSEWTDMIVTKAGLIEPTSEEWQEYYDIVDFKGFNIAPPYYYDSGNGIGRIKVEDNDHALRGFVRGETSLYDLDLSNPPTMASSTVGFRCAK